MRDDEPRPVWMSLPITHWSVFCFCSFQFLLFASSSKLAQAPCPMASTSFRTSTSFPLVTASQAVTGRGNRVRSHADEASPRAAQALRDGEWAFVHPASASHRTRKTADVQRFADKQPIPCLLPTNSFIDQMRRRDEEHLARSHLSLVHAMERLQLLERAGDARGGTTQAGSVRMTLQPHVTLRYSDENDEEVCLSMPAQQPSI
jgi:hypothetical protein